MNKKPAAEHVVVVTGDLHLDEHGAWKHRDLVGDSRYAFEQIVAYCVDEAEHPGRRVHLVLLGDINNKPDPKPKLVGFLHRQLRRLEDAGCLVRYGLGQHDGRQDWLSTHPWPSSYHRCSFQLGPWKAYGLNWSPIGQIEEELRAIPPGTEVLLAHQVHAEFMGVVATPEMSLAQVPYVKAIFTGDFHRVEQQVIHRTDGSEIRVFSPGAIAIRKINEPDSHSFFVFRSADFTPEVVPLKHRPVIRMTLGVGTHFDPAGAQGLIAQAQRQAAADGVPEELQTPILDLVYPAELEELVARIESVVQGQAHVFKRPQLPKQAVEIESAPLEETVAVGDLFDEVAKDDEADEATRALGGRLLAAQGAGALLQEERTSFMAAAERASWGLAQAAPEGVPPAVEFMRQTGQWR
ncbi:MAG TPA: hypothetical protein VN719_02865 [Gemmatimonadales bacterium]|nr:hypothetical protein [Gemmatimonadales bacterium]